MNLYLMMQQAGEGCDYTIGCGKTFYKLRSTDMENAKKETSEIILDSTNSEQTIEKALIVELKEDISMFGEIAKNERYREQQDRDRLTKKAQLEKLKRELGED